MTAATWYPGDVAVQARAAAFLTWYREAYKRERRVPYMPTLIVQQRDLDSACRMAAELDDDTMRQVALVFLNIPGDRERLLRTGARTVSQMLHLAPTILERLQS